MSKFKTILAAIFLMVFSVSVQAGTDAKDMKEIAPVIATSDEGFYVSLEGGASLFQDHGNGRTTLNDPSAAGTYGPFGTSNTTSQNGSYLGGVGGLKFGYRFESYDTGDGFALQPAVEFDGYYVGTETGQVSNFRSAAPVPITLGPLNGTIGATSSGHDDAGAFLINGIIRFKNPSAFTPYIGLGVGGEFISSSRTFATTFNYPGAPSPFANINQGVTRSDSDLAFAVQSIAGLDYKITAHLSLFGEYKFLAAIDPSFTYNGIYGGGLPAALSGGGPGPVPTNINNESYKFHPDYLGQHIVVLGLTYNF